MSAHAGALAFIHGVEDKVVRRRISLWEELPAKHATLMSLYRYWEALRPEGLIPRRSAFDVMRLKPVMGMTTLVDVGTEDPMDFRFRLVGSMVPLEAELSGIKVQDYHSEAYRRALAEDYMNAKQLRAPAYHEIVGCIDYLTHSYARLILPFSNDGRAVAQLLVASAHQDFPDLLKLLD